MKDVILYKQSYKLFPYETILAEREVNSLLVPTELICNDGVFIAKGCQYPEEAINLTYFSSYEIDGEISETKQHKREGNKAKRQNTRYYAHGIHEYKGKFNPQIVRTLLNIYKIHKGQHVLDPFCGSGTSLFECQLQGIIPTGVDINPMATFIAKVKTTIASDIKAISTFKIDKFIAKCKQHTFTEKETERTNYLHKWFDDEYYGAIESIRQLATKEKSEALQNLLLLTTSNFLRDYSCQEPGDLRIRRRTTPYPNESIWSRLEKDFVEIQAKIERMCQEDAETTPQASIYNESIIAFGSNPLYNDYFDFALTSPPYATALPYIDTQRLSIVWLGMALGKDIKGLECSLIGTREIGTKKERNSIETSLHNNEFGLSMETYDFCMSLENKLTDTDGFRKRNVPIMLYKYFTEMSNMFSAVYSLLKANSKYCLIVGYNRTKIGGDTLIDTPYFLSKEAERIGFHVEEILPLEAYQRYDLHQKNAITSEALIVLTK